MRDVLNGYKQWHSWLTTVRLRAESTEQHPGGAIEFFPGGPPTFLLAPIDATAQGEQTYEVSTESNHWKPNHTSYPE